MDDDDSIEDKAETDNNEQRQTASLKPFSLLNALSDLLMLPKDMLLTASIRNEVNLAMKLNFSSCCYSFTIHAKRILVSQGMPYAQCNTYQEDSTQFCPR